MKGEQAFGSPSRHPRYYPGGKKNVAVRLFVSVLVSLVASCLLSSHVWADAERLSVAYPQWPPYKIIENGRFGGIDALVLEEISRRTGVQFDYVECPWARCLIMLQDGSVDMITSIARTAGRQAVMAFLEPPTRDTYAISFYMSGGSPRALSRYEDLYGLDIGIIRGSAYFERFDHDDQLRKTAVTRETQLLDMLAGGRLDVILGIGANLDYLLHETRRSGLIKKASLNIETKDPAFIAISKRSKHQGVIPRIEQALRDMRRVNAIEQIERSFLRANQ
jgi:polar amino acid transport system substrate-binding protein